MAARAVRSIVLVAVFCACHERVSVGSFHLSDGDARIQGSAGEAGAEHGFSGSAGGPASSGTSGEASAGDTSAAGASGSGGTAGTGGSAGSGAMSCGSSLAIDENGFVTAPALGGACWQGYAFTASQPETLVEPSSFVACGPACTLHATATFSGNVAGNGYVELGFSLNQDRNLLFTDSVVPKGRGLAITYAKAGNAEGRVWLRSPSSEVNMWCAPLLPSGSVIAYDQFTECWLAGENSPYAGEPIEQLGIYMLSSGTEPFSIAIASVQEI